MTVTPTYPGVYVVELPSSVRTITAVSTSVTAFVGYTGRGPVNRPVTLTSFADFERRFGGLAVNSMLSYSVQQFFLNGGSTAIVVRVARDAVSASKELNAAGNPVLSVSAQEPGVWGQSLRVTVDPDTPTPDRTFNLRVGTETYRDLSMDKADPRFVESVVNPVSTLITVAVKGNNPKPPEPSGTVSKELPAELPDLAGKQFSATIDGDRRDFTLYDTAEEAPANIMQLALLLERKIRAAAPDKPAFAGAQVRPVGNRLQVNAGEPDATIQLTGQPDVGITLQDTANPGAFALAGGSDGTAPADTDIIGSASDKTGLGALVGVSDVNLLCLPEVADFDTTKMVGVLTAAHRLCVEKRMLLLVDPPTAWKTLDLIRGNLGVVDQVRGDHAALYVPRIQVTDPLTGRLRELPPSGAVAGVMARTDSERGVWKAPAGTDAKLAGVLGLTVPLTDAENGLLNPLGVNVLRTFPITGTVVWGARTLDGADATGSQWKYVPVRRLALMIEESLYRGTQWVVFEPNDERLWGQIRLNVGAFLNTLFRQGAFQGTSAREAYFVKCDKDTTTQDDINRGVVNILVGFAPLKPAEFVIIQIEQLAGQIEV